MAVGSAKTGKGRKIGRNKDKCASYRARVGKPAGRGMTGSKHPKGWPERRTF